MNDVLGYTYSTGSVLCAKHATSTHDPYVTTGQAIPIYADSTTHMDLVCDVPDCGVILARNCTDNCNALGYDHFLYYDERSLAYEVFAFIKDQIDASAEIIAPEGSYAFAVANVVAFGTENELSDRQAQALIERLAPDAYDLNCVPEEHDMCL